MSETVPQESSNDYYIQRIKDYVDAKKVWLSNVPEVIGPQTYQYESFAGHRGAAVKKNKERIAMGILEDGEEDAAKEKTEGDAAFRSGDFDGAADHYTKATSVWGHPHNAVCHSNLSAAYLKLQKWKEAELAAQMALREHTSIHGFHYGMFHIKVYHRLGLANMGLGRYEVAEEYFMKALKINGNNAAAKSDLKAAREKIKSFGTDLNQQIAARKDGFGLTDQEIQCVVASGAKPWDEDVQDLLEVSGLRPNTREPVKDMDQISFPSEREMAKDSVISSTCSWCSRPPPNMAFMTCRACGKAALCSDRCGALNWKGHAVPCKTNRDMVKTLSKGNQADAVVARRVQKWLQENGYQVGWAALAALGTLGPDGNRMAFQDHIAIVDVGYEPDEEKPLSFLDIRKISIKDAEARYAKSLTGVGAQRALMDQEKRRVGLVGVCLAVIMVEDKDWQCAVVHSLDLPQNYWAEVPDTAFPEDWKEKWLFARHMEEREKLE